MPSDNKKDDKKDNEKDDAENAARSVRQAKATSSNMALALELPFTFVGAVAVGVVMGYFLDRWLHTKLLFALLLGALGFFAGLREVLRRLPGTNDGTGGN